MIASHSTGLFFSPVSVDQHLLELFVLIHRFDSKIRQ